MTNMIDVLHNCCQFFAHESCGQCTPCREGTGWLLKIMDRMRRGQGRSEDLDVMLEVANSIGIIPGTTICGLAGCTKTGPAGIVGLQGGGFWLEDVVLMPISGSTNKGQVPDVISPYQASRPGMPPNWSE